MTSLERYSKLVVPEKLGALERPGASLAELRAYFDGLVSDLMTPEGRMGCLMVNSVQSVRAHGRVCQVGFLGGLDPVADFNPIADLPSGVQLSSFISAFALGDPDFPLSAVPIQDIVDKVERGVLAAKPKRVFAFEDIAEAHRLLDTGQAGGKLVVAVA
jgi:NADPH:quinone reductase-like Zn-dependent oxidoreductase